MSFEANLADLKATFEGIQKNMMDLQKLSAEHNLDMSAITTILGKNANRAASEVPTRG